MTGIPECVLASLALCGPPTMPAPTVCPSPTLSPPCVAPWAQPGVTTKFAPTLVGGSVGFRTGRPACTHEGVWGLDFVGRWRLRRVRLFWPTKAVEREPVDGKDPTRYENKLPETPPPPFVKKL